MKIKGSSNILATNKNKKTYRGEVVGRETRNVEECKSSNFKIV